jgi:hypothetical protein
MKSRPVAIRFDKGVNLIDDPAALKEDEVARAKNLWMRKQGVVGKRPSMNFAESIWQDGSLGVQAIVREFAWLPTGAFNSMVAIIRESGVDKMKLMPPAFYGPSYLGTPKEQSIGLSKLMPHTVAYQNKVYVFNGESAGWYFDPADKDTQGQFNFKPFVWSDPASNSVKPSFCAVVRERFWYANLGPGFEDWVVVSDFFTPNSISPAGVDPLVAGGRGFRVGNAGEGPITAIAELSATSAGTEASTMVAVWKGNNMFLLTGQPLKVGEAGDPLGTLDIIRVNTRAGCASQRSVVSTPYGTFWAGFDDVWCMPHGGQPTRVGTKIRPALQASPAQLTYLWHAEYDEGQYKLALFSDGLGPSDTSACDEQWWLDLRNGIPDALSARWMGPQVFVQSSSDYKGTTNMHLDTRPGMKRRLISLASYIVLRDPVNDPTDLFRGLSLVSFDAYNARDTVAPNIPFRDWIANSEFVYPDIISTYVVDSSGKYTMQTFVNSNPNPGALTGANRPPFTTATDYVGTGADAWLGRIGGINIIPATYLEPPSAQSGNEVLVDIIAKEHLFDPMTQQLWDGVEVGFSTSNSFLLKYIAIMDYELDTRVIILDPSSTSLDAIKFGSITADRKWQARFLPPDPTKRSVGQSGQTRIYDVACIPVNELNGALYVSMGGAYALCDIAKYAPLGYVDSIDEYIAAIVSAISATYPVTALNLEYQRAAIIETLTSFDIIVATQATTGVTEAQAAVNRRILAILGMPVTGASFKLWDAVVNVKGQPTYHTRQVAMFELSGINAKYRQFKRRPT